LLACWTRVTPAESVRLESVCVGRDLVGPDLAAAGEDLAHHGAIRHADAEDGGPDLECAVGEARVDRRDRHGGAGERPGEAGILVAVEVGLDPLEPGRRHGDEAVPARLRDAVGLREDDVERLAVRPGRRQHLDQERAQRRQDVRLRRCREHQR
jgi:hypothetical protein